MSGQGSGGGGALVLLFGLWVVAVFIVVGPLRDSPPEATESIAPSPTPDLTFGIVCETEEDCAGSVSRAELASALDTALELPTTSDDRFTDDDGTEHEDAINRIAAAGLMGGCGDETFCPDDGATRGQLAAILVRSFQIAPGGPNAFDDDDGSLFEADINAVAAAGFSGGCGERRFCPDREVSRQALRDLLSRVVAFLPSPSATPSAAP
jgi:hypothetical protein